MCPSCSRKRTILLAEHLTNTVLLKLSHRQFVFSMPKALRPFFRHDRRLFADVSRLIYLIIDEFYHEAAGRPLLTGMVIAHQTFRDMLRWNPHSHAIVLEGGFDEEGTFFSIPFSGFSIDNSVRILDESTSSPTGRNTLRRKNCSSSGATGSTHRSSACNDHLGFEPLSDEDEEVGATPRKRAWARLLANVYEVDPFVCPKCGADMKVIAVIEDPDELKRILRHLIKIGRSPPGFNPDRLN